MSYLIHYTAIGTILLILLGVCAFCYIVQVLAYKKIMELLEFDNTVFAFIPIYNWYLLMERVVPSDLDARQWVIKLAPLASFLNSIPVIGSIAAIVVGAYGNGEGIGYLEEQVYGNSKDANKVINYVLGYFKLVWYIKVLAN